jgi:hypothetical protein
MEKGILTLEQEQKLGILLDDAIKLKGWIPELLDGYVFKAIITLVDDTFIDKLQEDLKVKLAALADAVMAEDIELSETLSTDIINELVDIPGLDEGAEGLIFKAVIEITVGAVIKWIVSKKSAKTEKPVVVTLKLKK